MNRALTNLDQPALDQIHQYSLQMLHDVGIRFPSDSVLQFFRRRGFRTEGDTVFFSEEHITQALETVPTDFTIEARNPEHSVYIGGTNYVVAPGYGPPFIIEPSGELRDATLSDAKTFYKLVQTSKHIDFNSALVVHPGDVPAQTAYLDLLLSSLTLTDKPLMGSSASQRAAQDSMSMAKILWGELDRPVMIALINSLSPFQFAQEMAEA